jgi:mevalonate kinase
LLLAGRFSARLWAARLPQVGFEGTISFVALLVVLHRVLGKQHEKGGDNLALTVAYAPGKVILFGEHAVVYGRPAVAVPVLDVQAMAVVEDAPLGSGITVVADDLNHTFNLLDVPRDDPLRVIVSATLARLGVGMQVDLKITVSSTIPIARGLGSGAAISTAIARALGKHQGQWLTSRAISDLAFETEKIYHGTPSGIDNTVIAFEKPVFFVKDKIRDVFWVRRPFQLVIGDTGIASLTKVAVKHVWDAWQQDRERYEEIFDEIGTLAHMGREAIEVGDVEAIGRLMDANHKLLRLINVSSPELEGLIQAARQGGALGAKLAGAGRGGNMIAVVTSETVGPVSMMLRLAGAKNVIVTEIR